MDLNSKHKLNLCHQWNSPISDIASFPHFHCQKCFIFLGSAGETEFEKAFVSTKISTKKEFALKHTKYVDIGKEIKKQTRKT